MFFRLFLFLTILNHSIHPNGAHPSLLIAGGNIVSIEQVPYQVALLSSGVYNGCGGSIISRSFVLTAGHCVVQEIAANLAVRVGSKFRTHGGMIYPIASKSFHEQFNVKEMDHDFALLRLSKPIKFNHYVQPIAVLPETPIPVGTLLSTSGWGLTCTDESRTNLRSVKVPLVDRKKCRALYPCFTEAMVCAGYQDRKVDASKGDSGGPLVYNNTLIGVTSFGPTCDEMNCPGVYARVSAVYQWIHKIITNGEKLQISDMTD